MTLKSSTQVFLADFLIASPSFFIDMGQLSRTVKLAWLAILCAGAVVGTIAYLRERRDEYA